MPRLGLTGVGVATSTVYLLSFLALYLSAKKDEELAPLLTPDITKADAATVKRLVGLGVPIAATYGSEAGFFSITALMAGSFGPDALAAHTAVNQLVYIVFQVAVGLSHAASINVSRELALGNHDDARRLKNTALACAAAVMAVVGLLYLTIPELILAPFLNSGSAQALTIATHLLIVTTFLSSSTAPRTSASDSCAASTTPRAASTSPSSATGPSASPPPGSSPMPWTSMPSASGSASSPASPPLPSSSCAATPTPSPATSRLTPPPPSRSRSPSELAFSPGHYGPPPHRRTLLDPSSAVGPARGDVRRGQSWTPAAQLGSSAWRTSVEKIQVTAPRPAIAPNTVKAAAVPKPAAAAPKTGRARGPTPKLARLNKDITRPR